MEMRCIDLGWRCSLRRFLVGRFASLRIFFDVRGRIPPPQSNNIGTHCDELGTKRDQASRARKIVKKGERYGEEGFNDWEFPLTGADTRTVNAIVVSRSFLRKLSRSLAAW